MELSKYRVWCNDESAYVVTDYKTSSPETSGGCPNNSTHVIDTTKSVRVNTVTDIEPRDLSGKMRIHETSRALGTTTVWAGHGDDSSDINAVGEGTALIIDHELGDDMTQSIYIDFNIANNETWLHEGYVTWKDAYFDALTLELVPRVTATESVTGGNYQLYGGYLVIPCVPGTGNLNLTGDITSPNGGLIYLPDNDLGEAPTAFWNADWNGATYENITAAPTGNGRYNMFTVEVPLARFICHIPLLGGGFQMLQSADSHMLGQGMRLKMTADTYGDDHHWDIACIMTMHRKRTV